MSKNTLSTESYKGVRDFYPEDQYIQNHIANIWKKSVQAFGYEEYNASVIEPAELYKAKSGEEIINEQTYTFTDRGDREVTLRPEMTPTVARMVAGKRRELAFPLRWYSIPNLFRYEKPQRGRLREHWQLNVDIFGVDSIEAEVEIISIASTIMRNFDIEESNYEIRINSRKIINYMLYELFGFNEETGHKLGKLIDRKDKMKAEEFESSVEALAGEHTKKFITLLNSKNFEEFLNVLGADDKHEAIAPVKELLARLDNLGIGNAVFDQTLMRGFDYYTGIVFEVFDKHPDNRRALFGGGRYDDLLSLFGNDKVSAVGFGMGDVTMRDTLETYDLLPTYKTTSEIYLILTNTDIAPYAQELAQKLRGEGAKVSLDYSFRKIQDQLKTADKIGIPFVVVIGEDEVKTGKFKIKHLGTGKEVEVTEDTLLHAIRPKE
jgi:histidyl-tRNA synthetase